MSEIVTEFRFDLKRSNLSYSNKGEQEDATFILLKAPTSRHSRQCAFLKQAFFRAVPKEEPKKKDKEFETPTGLEMINILAMSQDVDLADVIDVGKDLLSNGVALVDGDQKLNKLMIDQLHEEDVEEMIGLYMVVFTLASTLERMNEK